MLIAEGQLPIDGSTVLDIPTTKGNVLRWCPGEGRLGMFRIKTRFEGMLAVTSR
jgi:hypothetical protein